MSTAPQAETPLRRFVCERFPSRAAGDAGAGDDDDENDDRGRHHSSKACCDTSHSGNGDQYHDDNDNDDDDSSAAMDRFLMSRMDAVLSSNSDIRSCTSSGSMSSISKPTTRRRIVRRPSSVSTTEKGESSALSWQEADAWVAKGNNVNRQDQLSPRHETAAIEGSREISGGLAAKQQQQNPKNDNSEVGALAPPPDESDCTTAASSTQTSGDAQLTSTPVLRYNPFSNYSSSPTRPVRKEIMGMSIPVLACSSPSFLPGAARRRRAASAAAAAAAVEDLPYGGGGGDDDSSVDPDDALELWARQIRVELRHAEMVDLAVEAERAAESGIESFAVKLSTYGMDDSLLATKKSAFKETDKSIRFKRIQSFSEGTKISLPIRRSRSVPSRIPVTDLRDVEEVFPSFGQFHSHLRTHFARSSVDERSLIFKEEKRRRWGSSSSLSSNHSKSPSDLLFNSSKQNQHKSRSPSDFFKHPSSTADFFKHPRSPSDMFKHNRSPSDFFQNLWINSMGSGDTADESEVVDVLADHIQKPDGRLRKLPKIIVPDGLDLPDLTMDRPAPRRKEGRKLRKQDAHGTGDSPKRSYSEPAGPHSPPVMTIRKQQLSPKALFDQDDGLESDPESPPGSPLNTHEKEVYVAPPPPHPPSPPPPQPQLGTPVTNHKGPGPDFLTPARLRIIRNRTQELDLREPEVENVLVAPNSVLASPKPQSARPVLEYRTLPPALQDNAAAILLPERLGGPSEERPILNVGFKPRSGELSEDDPSDRELDDAVQLPDLQDSRSSLSMRLSPVKQVEELAEELPPSLDENPKTPERTNPMDDSGIAASSPDTSQLGKKKSPRRRKVKVMIYGAGPSSPEQSAMSGGGSSNGSVLQHTQTLSLADSDDAREHLADSPNITVQNPDCGCLALSAPCSPKSMCSSAPPVDTDDEKALLVKPVLLKRSSSAGALSSLDTGRDKWNPFATAAANKTQKDGSKRSVISNCSNKQPFQAAMDIFSRISPKRKERSLYLPPKDNDDFLHNYMYCSKPPQQTSDGVDHDVCNREACADVSTDVCCTSFFADTSYFGPYLPVKRRSGAGPLLSLSGDSYARLQPETWFGIASDHFDGVLQHIVGRADRGQSPWNVSFQAPTLRKNSEVTQKDRERIYSMAAEDEGAAVAVGDYDVHFDDEKKSDTTTTADFGGDGDDSSSAGSSSSGSSKHTRHLSYFPSRGPQSALSDNQFEFIYGMSREDFADNLARNIDAYPQNSPGGIEGPPSPSAVSESFPGDMSGFPSPPPLDDVNDIQSAMSKLAGIPVCDSEQVAAADDDMSLGLPINQQQNEDFDPLEASPIM